MTLGLEVTGADCPESLGVPCTDGAELPLVRPCSRRLRKTRIKLSMSEDEETRRKRLASSEAAEE